jgi:hypothetical protein
LILAFLQTRQDCNGTGITPVTKLFDISLIVNDHLITELTSRDTDGIAEWNICELVISCDGTEYHDEVTLVLPFLWKIPARFQL